MKKGKHTRNPNDPKTKVNFRIRQSLLCIIEEKSYELGIAQSTVVDMILSSSLPVFEKVHKKEIDLMHSK